MPREDRFQDVTIHGTLSFGAQGTFASPLTVGSWIVGDIDGILFVDGAKYTTVQAAINALPAAGGVVVLRAGSTYVGPTSIPSGVTIMALGAATPGGSMSFTQPAYTTTLTYSADLTIGPAQSIGLIGVTLDFTGANTLTISSVQNSVFDMVVRSATGSPAITFTSTVLGGANYWNRYRFLQVITGGATALQWTSPATSFATNNHYAMLVPVLTGTTGKALSFVQNCDSNYFENVKAFWTNVGAVTATGVVFNDSGTPAANTDADYIKISWMDFTFSGSVAAGSVGLTVNKSTGNTITVGVGLAAFPTTATYTGNPDITIYDPGGAIVPFGSGSVATNFTLAPTSGTQTNTTRLVSGNPSGGIVLTMPTATDTLIGRATTDTLSNKTVSDTLPVKRLKASQGTALVAGDFALDPNWGVGASIGSITGTDQGFSFTVTAAGVPGANPTVVLTFKDGTWTSSPLVTISRSDATAPTTGFWAKTAVSATTVTFTFVGTPVAGNTYSADAIVMGR